MMQELHSVRIGSSSFLVRIQGSENNIEQVDRNFNSNASREFSRFLVPDLEPFGEPVSSQAGVAKLSV